MAGVATRTPGDTTAGLPFLATCSSSMSPPESPTQVALVVFAIHTLVAEENAMDAEKAFVTLTVLNILNKAQAFLPFSIHSVVQVRWQGGEAVLEEPCRGVAGCAGARKRSRERDGRAQGTAGRCQQTSSK